MADYTFEAFRLLLARQLCHVEAFIRSCCAHHYVSLHLVATASGMELHIQDVSKATDRVELPRRGHTSEHSQFVVLTDVRGLLQSSQLDL